MIRGASRIKASEARKERVDFHFDRFARLLENGEIKDKTIANKPVCHHYIVRTNDSDNRYFLVSGFMPSLAGLPLFKDWLFSAEFYV